MADCCKTLCKVCGNAFSLVNMRNHTLSAHKLQITKYKEEYGPFELLQEVWHACYLCGDLVLLDNDHLGSHIKSVHKMKEKVKKESVQNQIKGKKNEPKSVSLMEGELMKVAPKMASGHVWGEKPFTCKEQNCAKAFGDESDLKRHLAVHRMENNLQAAAENSLKEENEAAKKPPACRTCEGCKKRKGGCKVIALWKQKNTGSSEVIEAVQVGVKCKVLGKSGDRGTGKQSKILVEQGQEEDNDDNTNMISLSRNKVKKGLTRNMKEQEIATEVEEVEDQEEDVDVNRTKPSRSQGREGGMARQVKVQEVATEGSTNKRKVEESLVPPLGRKLVEDVGKESDEGILFLGFKRREGMRMSVTVGDVLHQRENIAWRCHLDKDQAEGSKASQSVRKDENELPLRSRFKGPKKRKEMLSKLDNDMPEENKETEKGKSFDPFVYSYYDCAVADCQDCKELELL